MTEQIQANYKQLRKLLNTGSKQKALCICSKTGIHGLSVQIDSSAHRSRFSLDSVYLQLKASPFWNDSNNWIAIITFTLPIFIFILIFGISFGCTRKIITHRAAFVKSVTNISKLSPTSTVQHRCSRVYSCSKFDSQIQNIEYYFEKLSFNSSRNTARNTTGRLFGPNFEHRYILDFVHLVELLRLVLG